MATARTAGGEFTLELALHGRAPVSDVDELHRTLTAAGAAKVDQVLLTAPQSDQRVAELVEVPTLLVGGVANVVAIIEAVRGWLARRREAAAHEPVAASGEDEVVPTVVVTLNGDTLTLVHPSDRATDDAIARFYEHHRRD